MIGVQPQRRAFTLIETVVVVSIMALLTSAVALSFNGPIQSTRARDAINQVQSLDSSARTYAKRFGKDVEIVFDVSQNRLLRREGKDKEVSYDAPLPRGCRIERLRIGGRIIDSGEAAIACSTMGLTRSYTLHLVGPKLDRWISVAGLTGEMTVTADDSRTAENFETALSPRDDAD